MARPRQSDADLWFDDLTTMLATVPVWVGPVLATLAYALFRFLIPPIFKAVGNDAMNMLGILAHRLAWLPPLLVLGAWTFALFRRSSKKRLFDRQTGLDSVRNLSWKEFETLIGEAFRRQGYTVAETGSPGADGGVDIVLTKAGEETLVQCKRWKEWKVGVEKVRELYGVMASRGSTGGILVSSGTFTEAAHRFAEGKSLTLIDGQALAKLIAGIQAKPAIAVVSDAQAPAESVVCPQCGSAMTLRTAKTGPHPGSQFWGCSRYPACKGTRPQLVGG